MDTLEKFSVKTETMKAEEDAKLVRKMEIRIFGNSEREEIFYKKCSTITNKASELFTNE